MLIEIAENLWCSEHDLFMPGRVHFPIRMTVIRLRGGGLILHSPIPIDDALAAELAALGPVEHLIAPCKLHHLYLPAAIERYPDAKVHGAPGLAEKRGDIRFDATLGEGAAPWESELDSLLIGGVPWINEVVFFHRATKTLIVTDLVFNIHEVRTWMSVLVLRFIARAYRTFAQSRLWRFKTEDRQAVATSARAVLAWDFTRVVMAHGRVIDEDAHARTRQALAWMLAGQPALAPAA